MATVETRWSAWLRRNWAWSNSRESWEERGALFLLALGAAAAWSWGGRLPVSQQVVLWGLLLASSAAVLRRGWLKLFGPVLFYDLVRSARRSRYILFRCLYALALLAVLLWLHATWTIESRYSSLDPIRRTARMAESFFATFTTMQLLAVFLLTPAYTAGAIAEEKDRRTLEFLLATDLRNREIVLSKLAARMLNLGLILLAGLPILSSLQFLGGVDPFLMWACFAATALSMASLAALSILASVYLRKPRDAIAVTYLLVIAFLGLPPMLEQLFNFLANNATSWPLWFGADPWTTKDVLEGLASLMGVLGNGNIFKAYFRVATQVFGGGRMAGTLGDVLIDYALFHVTATVVCATWAVARLRAIALKEAEGKPARSPRLRRWHVRPQVGSFAMIWKEVFAEPGARTGWGGRIAIMLLVLLSFVPVVVILDDYLRTPAPPPPAPGSPNSGWYRSPWQKMSEGMNIYVRVVGTMVACLMLLGVATRAAGSVSGERDKQTFDTLLTTPLDSDAILFGKWLGSIASVRWSAVWLGFIAALGVALGGLNVLAIPFLTSAWLILASFVAIVGVWYSANCRTTLRATVATLLSIVFVYGGHWMVAGMCCYMPVSIIVRGPGRDFENVLQFQLFGLTPPFTLGLLAFRGEDFQHQRDEPYKFAAFALIGLLMWALATVVIWTVTSIRFRSLTNRTLRTAPERLAGQPEVGPVPRPDWASDV